MERFVTAAEVNPVLIRELSWSDRLQCMVGPFYVEVAGVSILMEDMPEECLASGESNDIPGLAEDTTITLTEEQRQMIADALNNTARVEELRAKGIEVEAIPRFDDANMQGTSLGCAWNTGVGYPDLKRVKFLQEY